MSITFKFAILTVSDKGSRGERIDTAGESLKEMLSGLGGEMALYEIVPDEREVIASRLAAWSDGGGIDLVVTTGGTGLAPRDVTPEATLSILDRLAPGIPEAMRAASMTKTPLGMLSRSVAGARKSTLIINVPGSQRAATECLEAVLPVITHAIQTLRGRVGDHVASPEGAREV